MWFTGPTPSSGFSTPIVPTTTPTVSTNQNTSSSVHVATSVDHEIAPVDHVNHKEERGLTRQAAVAVDPVSRKGPPPVPTRASSTALTDKEQQQMRDVQQRGVAAPQDASSNLTTATKVPPKIAKKPKGAKKQSPQPRPPVGKDCIIIVSTAVTHHCRFI